MENASALMTSVTCWYRSWIPKLSPCLALVQSQDLQGRLLRVWQASLATRLFVISGCVPDFHFVAVLLCIN